MSGLQKILKSHGEIYITDQSGNKVVWVWDYANDKPRVKSEMTGEEIAASERAEWGGDNSTQSFITALNREAGIIDEPKRYVVNLQFDTMTMNESEAFLDEVAKGASVEKEWNCAKDQHPLRGKRVIVQMDNGDINYGTSSGNGVFWVVISVDYNNVKGAWRSMKFPFVQKWKPFN